LLNSEDLPIPNDVNDSNASDINQAGNTHNNQSATQAPAGINPLNNEFEFNEFSSVSPTDVAPEESPEESPDEPLQGTTSLNAQNGVSVPTNAAILPTDNTAETKNEVTPTSKPDPVNEAPEGIDFDRSTISENAAIGTVVAKLSAVDDDQGDSFTYQIIGDTSGDFEIIGDQIVVASGTNLDFENATTHDITVQVTDAAGNTFTETVTIDVTDFDEFDITATTDTDTSANTIAENATAGDTVGIVANASDADATNSNVTYSVDDARFEVASDGTVTVATGASFDAETEGAIDIVVTSTSEDGSTSNETFTLAVSDINEAAVSSVTDSDTDTNEVAENAAAGTSVGITANATDSDVTDNVSYSLTDNAGGLFQIDATTGEVTTTAGLDAETAASYQIEVTATSDDGSTTAQTYTINVNDQDEFDITATTDTDTSANTIAENATAGDTVGIVANVSDADATNSNVTYSVDDARFEVASDGTVTVATGASFDAETGGAIDIVVTSTSEDGSTSNETFTLAVSDINEASVGSISDTNTDTNAVSENAAAGTSVGITASASDSDVTDNVSYSLTNDAGGLFQIDASTGEVTTTSGLDAEVAASYDIEVIATSDDGSTSAQSYTINVNDQDEFDITATTDTDTSANTIAENAVAGDTVGIVANASDADATNSNVSYTVDDARFEVAADGTVSVATGASFDAETEGAIDIVVTSTSEDGSTSNETFTLAVSDINEASVGSISDTNTDTNAVSENAAAGTSVGITALASDGDVTDGVTYSLSDDAGGLFDIDANTGVVTVAGSLDAETATSHTIEVTATSDDGSTSTQSFTIGVNDVNETSISAISDNDGTGNTVTEGASVGTAVGITALASDADVTDTISYSLSSNPGDFFAIDANTGEVTVAGSLDYETDTSHTIDVTATSSDGTTSTQTFTIAVGDEDEFDVGAISDTDGAANAVDENAAAGTTVGVVALATDADGSNSDVTYSLSDDAGEPPQFCRRLFGLSYAANSCSSSLS
jgi:hypothetical protein